jgi:hypothetical protein
MPSRPTVQDLSVNQPAKGFATYSKQAMVFANASAWRSISARS